jgi:hypothetical protein
MPPVEIPLVSRTRHSSLVKLPLELQPFICSHLSYNDLQVLRQVNQFYRSLITVDFMRLSFTSAGLNAELSTVCQHCLRQEPTGEKLLWLRNGLFPKPLTAQCEDCVVRRRLLTPGDKVYTKSATANTYICWWCGWPTWDDQEFHPKCRSRYQRACLIHSGLHLFSEYITFSTNKHPGSKHPRRKRDCLSRG